MLCNEAHKGLEGQNDRKLKMKCPKGVNLTNDTNKKANKLTQTRLITAVFSGLNGLL